MPFAAVRHCPHGHPPFSGRRCPLCQSAWRARSEASRPSATARGYDNRWRVESTAFLRKPGNERCACGCGRLSNVVDHKVAHKGDQRLFWDRSNWQPMHRDCNSRKAIRSEGGFGLAPQSAARP